MDWRIDGAHKDAQSVTKDWEFKGPRLIEGAAVKEIRTVPKRNGHLVEVYRQDWGLDDVTVNQVFQVTLDPGGVSAWHAHATTTDRLFVSSGLVRIVLFDARQGSPTKGSVNEFRFGERRPGLVVIPPRVWHGVQNLSPSSSTVLNLVDQAYQYEDPDHWRVPADSPEIPFDLFDA